MSKISELTDGGSLLPTDTLIAVRSGANVKVVNDTINVTTLNPDQINMGDNEQIRLGNSQDLLIYHDGTNSIINDAGTGSLQLQQGGSTKLEVTATGIDVTGSVTADGLTVDGGANLLTRTSSGAEVDVLEVRNNATAASTASTIKFVNSTAAGSNSGSTELVGIRTGTSTGDFKIRTSNSSGAMTDRMLIDSNGDVSFYEDTGTTAKFFWDASAESLGIGTTNPAAKIDTAYTDSATYSSTSPSADLILSRKNTGNTANETVGIRFDVTGWSGSTTGGAAIEAIQPSNASTADLAFLTRDAGTWGERMRINSSGLVGISETNPSANLHISTNNTSTTNTATIRLEDTDTTTLGNQGIGRIEFYGNDSSGAGAGVKAAIEALGEDGSGRTTLKFSTANAVANDVGAMYINSSGQVGIGTTSPASLLHASSNESTVLTIERTASGTEGKLLLSSATNENIIYSRDATTGAKPLRFEIGSSEAMRITSAGNLLVGKTASDTSVNGLEADNNGYTKITRTSGTANVNTVLQLNRLSTDGEILRLQKDGTEVGSIGSYVTGPSMFIGSGNTGVLFADGSDSVHPWNPSTNAGNDDALDLGSSSQRFKDLYLSGNIDISTSSDPQTAFVDVAKTINDDAVYSFTPDKPIGIIYIYGRNANYSQAFGMVSYRTTATAYCVEVLDPNSFISTSTSVLTGTSGTDGQITISAVSSDGKIYIENRINNTISIGVHVSGQ